MFVIRTCSRVETVNLLNLNLIVSSIKETNYPLNSTNYCIMNRYKSSRLQGATANDSQADSSSSVIQYFLGLLVFFIPVSDMHHQYLIHSLISTCFHVLQEQFVYRDVAIESIYCVSQFLNQINSNNSLYHEFALALSVASHRLVVLQSIQVTIFIHYWIIDMISLLHLQCILLVR